MWNELFGLRQALAANGMAQVSMAKRIALLEAGRNLRLPAKMPSQYGEDVLLWNFFGGKRNGFYVDVGAYDGVGFSNSYFFEAIGWTGVLIEPVPEFAESCRIARPGSHVIEAAAGRGKAGTSETLNIASGPGGVGTLSYVGTNSGQASRIAREGGDVRKIDVPVVSLDEVLAGHAGDIDFVSIDVEGRELDVLGGFDIERYRPRVLVVEDNFGGTDPRVSEWLGARGYEARHRCQHNVFFVRRDEPGGFHW